MKPVFMWSLEPGGANSETGTPFIGCAFLRGIVEGRSLQAERRCYGSFIFKGRNL